LLSGALRRPEALLVGTFLVLIVLGTVLLALPVAAADGRPVGLLDALFTATSAVCVTGLITVDTATGFSRYGQTVILVLIQLGGLGMMTFGALAAQVLGQRLSFASQAAWRSSFFDAERRGDFRRALRQILLLTAIMELVGFTLLYTGLQRHEAPTGDWYDALFLSVSSFCNAGFSVYSESIVPLRDSHLILGTVAALIVAGGLGYTVWLEILDRGWRALRRRAQPSVRWSLHTRVVIQTSAVLIFGGAAALFFCSFQETRGTLTPRLVHALFQSVTARTAGFNTVDMSLVSVPALLVLVFLMFVGGSPGSCAGGIKTTTMAIWLSRLRSRLTGRDEVTIRHRAIPHDLVRRAALVIAVAAVWNAAGIMLLAVTEGPGVRFEHIIFEQVSAFATVGLSAGLTPELSVPGKLWIIASMFVGRVGPLTIALAVLARPRTLYRYPAERVMVG
jgi:trk system potassium uptake protein TrkH